MIAAILLERNLQSVANYLILSLAVADLLVAALVMPLGAVYEVREGEEEVRKGGGEIVFVEIAFVAPRF